MADWFGNGGSVVSALDVEVGDKVIVNNVVCKVVRVVKNFGAFGDNVVFDFFCEDRAGYYCDGMKFDFDFQFAKVN